MPVVILNLALLLVFRAILANSNPEDIIAWQAPEVLLGWGK